MALFANAKAQVENEFAAQSPTIGVPTASNLIALVPSPFRAARLRARWEGTLSVFDTLGTIGKSAR
jgi:hypothetical protein